MTDGIRLFASTGRQATALEHEVLGERQDIGQAPKHMRRRPFGAD